MESIIYIELFFLLLSLSFPFSFPFITAFFPFLLFFFNMHSFKIFYQLYTKSHSFIALSTKVYVTIFSTYITQTPIFRT